MKKARTLVLIDGNAVLHRAYHALPPLTTKSGQLVNAVYGFCSMLIRVTKELNPGYLIVCFDRPKPTFRQSIYIGYQHKRPKMDEDLAGQIEMVHKLVAKMNIPIYEKDGFEADDVIGTLARQANIDVIIVTGDKDLFQLVNKKIKIYMMVKGLNESALFSEKEIKEKYGIKPAQIIDYKALIGDSSDNYAGVPGIGPKTAVDLISQFGNLDTIYKKIKEIPKEKIIDLLKNGQESAQIARQLATIVTKAPVKIDLAKSKAPNLATEAAIEMLKELGFHSLIKRLMGSNAEEKQKSHSEQLTLV